MNQIFHLKMAQVYFTLANGDGTLVGHLPHNAKAKGSNLATSGKVHSLLPISMKKQQNVLKKEDFINLPGSNVVKLFTAVMYKSL